MAEVTYSPGAFQEVTVQRIRLGTGAGEDNDTHLIRFRVHNTHPTATIRGVVEVNGRFVRDSGPLAPGQQWTADFGTPGLALGGGDRVGWGVREVQ